MELYQNILAVVNREHDNRSVFLKSMYLSKKSGAKLTFLFIERQSGLFSNSSKQLSVNSVTGELTDLFKILKQNDVNFEIKQINVRQEYKGILQVLNQRKYDLVIKEKTPKHHNYLGLKPASDWHLLRDSPVPIMLVTKNKWDVAGNVLSAMETEDQDKTHLNINHQIMSHTRRISHLLHSHIHLINCYLGESMSIAFDSVPLINQKRLHLQHLGELLKDETGNPAATLHISQGLPENEISDLANKYHVNMAVIGTSEHRNFLNNVTGHTSEYIIDKLNCDVLTIKSQTRAYN